MYDFRRIVLLPSSAVQGMQNDGSVADRIRIISHEAAPTIPKVKAVTSVSTRNVLTEWRFFT
jgi:hypothetical protein